MKTKSLRTNIIGLWLFISVVIVGCVPVATAVPATDPRPDSDEVQTAGGNNPDLAEERRHLFSTLFAQVCIERTVYAKYDKIILHWPSDMTIGGDLAIRIMAGERIYAERHTPISADSTVMLGSAYVLPQGEYEIVLMPPVEEYYIEGVRIERRIAIEVWPHQIETIQEASAC